MKVDLFEEIVKKLPEWQRKIFIEMVGLKKKGHSLIISYRSRVKSASHLGNIGSSSLHHPPD